MPVTNLIPMMVAPPSDLVEAVQGLRHNSVFYAAFGYKLDGAPPAKHWLYIPDERYAMYRVGILSNYSPSIAPPGHVLVCAEVAFPSAEAAMIPPEQLRNRLLSELGSIGLVKPDWTLKFEHYGAINLAYVIFDDYRRRIVPRIMSYLEELGIYSVGRYGAWTYGSMEDAIKDGFDVAGRVSKALGDPGNPRV